VLDDVMTVAEAIGLGAAGERAMVELRRRLFEVTEYVNPFADGPSAAFLEWPDPLFVGGHWTPQLIERAGARHPLNATHPVPGAGAAAGPQSAGRVAGKSMTVTPESLVASAPEYLIIAPCGVALADVRRAAAMLRDTPWWEELPAVQRARRGEPRIALVDGHAMFNRPGPRLVDAQEFLVGFFEGRPELIPPGFPWELFADA
jgi:ABC-type Fe3+-hydroxamate transport system substrate-binding protein